MVITRDFRGGLNVDDHPLHVQMGDYIYALNITKDSEGEGQDIVVSGVNGNSIVTYSLPSGDNKIIGGCADELRNRYYICIWNSNDFDRIVYLNINTRSIVKVLYNLTDSDNVDILGFDPSVKIHSANIIHDDINGDLFYFIDSLKRPTKLNVETFASGTYSPVLREYINVAKAASQIPVQCVYENANSLTNNNLTNSLFQFSSRFVYDDKEKSVYSTQSIVPLPYNAGDQTIQKDPTKNGRIALYVETGDVNVKKIELHFRQIKNGVQSGWFLITSLNKAELGIADNTIYRFLFYNDGQYIPDDHKEAELLFDYVPLEANTQDCPNGDTIIYGGIKEGFNLTDPNMSSTLATISADQASYNGFLFFAYQPKDTNNVTLYLTGTGSNDGSDNPSTINNLSGASLFVRAQDNALADIGFNVTASSSTISTVLTQLQAAAVAAGWTFVSSDTNSLTISFTGAILNATFYYPNFLPESNANSDFYTSIPNANYSYGVIYYDEAGRTNSVITEASLNIITPYQTNGIIDTELVQIQITISHRPPLWAKTYQIVRTPQNTYGKLLNWVSVAAFSNVDQSTQNKYAYIGIGNIATYNESLKSSETAVGYEFSAGDRIRFNARWLADATTKVNLSNRQLDYEIISIETNPVYNGQVQYGNFVKIYYPTSDIDANFAFDNSANFQNYQILLYNYSPRVTDKSLTVFYEFGQEFKIGNAGTNLAYHMGNIQQQSTNLATPAIIYINSGDFFFRYRNVPIAATYYIEAGGDKGWGSGGFSDRYATGALINTDPLPVSTTDYTINAQTSVAAGLGVGDYPTQTDANPFFQNIGTANLTVRIRATIPVHVTSSSPSKLDVYLKKTNTGTAEVTTVLFQSELLEPGTTIGYQIKNVVIDSTVQVEAGKKLWLIVGNIKQVVDIVIDTYTLRVDVIKTITIPVIEDSFSDTYPMIKDGNGRPVTVDVNARQTYYPTLVRFSEDFQFDTNINNTNRFYFDNQDTYDLSYGDIQRLHIRDRLMHVYQKLKVGLVPILTQIIKDTTGNPLQANSDQLINKIQYYAGNYGIGDAVCSLAWNNYADYFVDDYRGVVCRLSQDGITPLSILYKTNAFFVKNLKAYRQDLNNGIAPAGQTYKGNPAIYGVFNAYTNKYIIALEEINRYSDPNTLSFHQEAYTIAFDEPKNKFESFYSYKPEWMGNVGTLLLSFKAGATWTHDSDTYCNFYGVQYDAAITPVFNDNVLIRKIFKTLTEKASDVWECPEITTDIFSYGATVQRSNLIEDDFTQEEGQYRAAILKDANSIGGIADGDEMRGVYAIVKFQVTNASDFVYLNTVSVKCIISKPVNQ